MGLNDAAEMLEVAKAENLRLEQELAAERAENVQLRMELHYAETGDCLACRGTGFADAAEHRCGVCGGVGYMEAPAITFLRGERDRARATAVRLEQELAESEWARQVIAGLVEEEDALVEARRTRWICE